MKTLIVLAICLTYFMPWTFAQSPAADIKAWLKPGEHVVSLIGMAPDRSTPREKELLGKAAQGAREHLAWFRDSLSTISSDLAAYHDKFGLTEEEFREYIQIVDKKKKDTATGITGHDTLKISGKGDILSFMGTGKLKPLDSLTINLFNNTVFYGHFELTYGSPKKPKGENSALKPFGTSYEYTFEDLGDLDPTKAANPASMNMTSFKLQLGHNKDTGETFLNFMGMRYVKGMPQLMVITPCKFQ
jgi:hypothetical protein